MSHDDVTLYDGFQQISFLDYISSANIKSVSVSPGHQGSSYPTSEAALHSEMTALLSYAQGLGFHVNIWYNSGGSYVNIGNSMGTSPDYQTYVRNAFADFLDKANQSSSLPSSWDNLITQWRSSISIEPISSPPSGTPNATSVYSDPRSGPFYDLMLEHFQEQLGYPGDWSLLTSGTPSPNPPVDFDAMFINAFNHFLENYSGEVKTINGTSSGTFLDPKPFFDNWYTFMGATSSLTQGGIPSNPDLVSYEQIYNIFHPGASQQDFRESLVQFYDRQIVQEGFFLPSQSLDEWFKQNQAEYSAIAGISAPAPFDNLEADKAQILNRLIRLLISMITILQKVGVSQANALKFVTNFQNVYVKLQTEIPAITRGDKFNPPFGAAGQTTPIGRKNTAADNERNQINSVFNASKTELIRALRGVQEDIAKQIQSRVNQTNDNVNQQTDMATALLQQLNGLISTIFR